jgi:hypothetical protein
MVKGVVPFGLTNDDHNGSCVRLSYVHVEAEFYKFHSSFAPSVSAKCFAESFAESFDNCSEKFCFLIHFWPVFKMCVGSTRTHRSLET